MLLNYAHIIFGWYLVKARMSENDAHIVLVYFL